MRRKCQCQEKNPKPQASYLPQTQASTHIRTCIDTYIHTQTQIHAYIQTKPKKERNLKSKVKLLIPFKCSIRRWTTKIKKSSCCWRRQQQRQNIIQLRQHIICFNAREKTSKRHPWFSETLVACFLIIIIIIFIPGGVVKVINHHGESHNPPRNKFQAASRTPMKDAKWWQSRNREPHGDKNYWTGLKGVQFLTNVHSSTRTKHPLRWGGEKRGWAGKLGVLADRKERDGS